MVIVHQLLLSLSRWTSLTLINPGINFPRYDFEPFRGSRAPSRDAPSTSPAAFILESRNFLCNLSPLTPCSVHHDLHLADSWTEMLISSDDCFKPLSCYSLALFYLIAHSVFRESGRSNNSSPYEAFSTFEQKGDRQPYCVVTRRLGRSTFIQ